MKLYVGVTDKNWFEFLRARPELDEVNFWQPSGARQFRVLQPGDPFLFKLHHPDNFIVGGGMFAHSSLCPVDMAWEAFAEKNGVGSLEGMRRRLAHYRKLAEESRCAELGISASAASRSITAGLCHVTVYGVTTLTLPVFVRCAAVDWPVVVTVDCSPAAEELLAGLEVGHGRVGRSVEDHCGAIAATAFQLHGCASVP
jgi:hypothetical protein